MISQHQSSSYIIYIPNTKNSFYNIFISLYPEITQGSDLNLTMWL